MKEPAASSVSRRFAAIALLVCAGSALSACGSYSGYLADHWPHFAGGEPAGLPPRPGAPSYAEYLARQNATALGGEQQTPPPGAPPPAEQTPVVGGPPPAPGSAPGPAGPRAPEEPEQNVGRGGLY